MNIISSADNQKIKDLVKLKKASERKERGVIIIDGAREIELAKKAGVEILELYYSSELVKNNTKNFFNLDQALITEVTEILFRKICYKENPDGFFALAKIKKININNLKLAKKPVVVVLEAVEKPGNLGAIIRTAYASGVDAIIINDSQTDIYNPNVIRASEGFIFNMQIVVASIEETVKYFKSNNIVSYAAATGGKNIYTTEEMNIPLAIILGSEAKGLSDKWLKKADKLVRIPMVKGIDSLNVSVSGAVLMYEALRQRADKLIKIKK